MLACLSPFFLCSDVHRKNVADHPEQPGNLGPETSWKSSAVSPARGHGLRSGVRDNVEVGHSSPVVVPAILSPSSIACACSGCICWAALHAMRATPALLALGPGLHPIGEGRIAVILRSWNFSILPTTLAMMRTAPLLFLCRPFRWPISLPVGAIERIYSTSDHWDWRPWRGWTLNEAPRTTAHDLVLRPMELVRFPVNQALVGLGPAEPAEQCQGQQQASECREDQKPAHVAAASGVVAAVANVLHCRLHRKLALARADVNQI